MYLGTEGCTIQLTRMNTQQFSSEIDNEMNFDVSSYPLLLRELTKASIDLLWQTIVPHHSDWLKSSDWYGSFKALSIKTCWWFVLYCKWYLIWPSVRTGLVPALFRWETARSLTTLLSYGLNVYQKLFRAWYKRSVCPFLENLGVMLLPWMQLS
jgi:hypothetical protein